MKSVRFRSFSGPYFSAFELNTERYSVSLRIQSECGKIRTKKTPNTDTFHAVRMGLFRLYKYNFYWNITSLFCTQLHVAAVIFIAQLFSGEPVLSSYSSYTHPARSEIRILKWLEHLLLVPNDNKAERTFFSQIFHKKLFIIIIIIIIITIINCY